LRPWTSWCTATYIFFQLHQLTDKNIHLHLGAISKILTSLTADPYSRAKELPQIHVAIM
jgi:hypothetical protein